MSSQLRTEREVHRIANEFGHDLAAALVLASSRSTDRAVKRQMAQIMLNQIAIAVRRLQSAAFPADLVELYERGARAGVRDELLHHTASLRRRAA